MDAVTKPAKKPVNIRVDEELLGAFDAWAKQQGTSRTQALEQFMRASVGLESPRPSPKAKAKVKAEKCLHPITRRGHEGLCFACLEQVGGK